MTPISRAAVEAGAEANWLQWLRGNPQGMKWADLSESSREAWRAEAQATIEGALSLLLADADAAESEGSWRVKYNGRGTFGQELWSVTDGKVLMGFGTEAEARAIANCLNRVAARATTTEGE